VGTELLQALVDYADNWLGLLRLELEVYADNHKAQALYRRFGFVEEGVHRCDTLRGLARRRSRNRALGRAVRNCRRRGGRPLGS
jgi:RimJ/RimL family protein N-acetyltransferase